ncbi:MAG TPA: YceI family protein [Burkholderiales bacterium]|nr:YceI family protein [Burkholderiales bacterium]
MHRQFTLALLGCVMSAPAFAADSYTIDPRHTFPVYEINHFGWSTQRGRFDKVTGRVVLDRAAKTGSVDVTIDVAYVDTGVDKLNEHLKSADFFDVAKYPTMTFKSTKIVFEGDKPASVPGQLTLHGVTKPVTLTISRFHCAFNEFVKKEVCGADATTTIKRTDFGMNYLAPGLGEEVKLLLNVEASKD